jgi:hypothetical protein
MPGFRIKVGSQGKGSRRGPWRDGGKRKQRHPEWRKQAMHATRDPAELGATLVSLRYRVPYRESPEHAIYRFDQKVAGTGIRYQPEYHGRWQGFSIHVLADHAAKVQELLTQLEAEDEESAF